VAGVTDRAVIEKILRHLRPLTVGPRRFDPSGSTPTPRRCRSTPLPAFPSGREADRRSRRFRRRDLGATRPRQWTERPCSAVIHRWALLGGRLGNAARLVGPAQHRLLVSPGGRTDPGHVGPPPRRPVAARPRPRPRGVPERGHSDLHRQRRRRSRHPVRRQRPPGPGHRHRSDRGPGRGVASRPAAARVPGVARAAGYIWSIQKPSSRSATLERIDGPGSRGMSWFQ
jgi:hypothetical protein